MSGLPSGEALRGSRFHGNDGGYAKVSFRGNDGKCQHGLILRPVNFALFLIAKSLWIVERGCVQGAISNILIYILCLLS